MALQFETDHRDYLKKELLLRTKRRPLYSQRAFARDLGLSPSSLGDYLKGHMRLSVGRMTQIAKMIDLNSEQTQHWIDLVEEKFSKSEEVKKVAKVRVKSRLQAQNHSLSLDQFKVISEWFHMAYLELIDMNAKKYSDMKVAAADLGLPLTTIKIAVKRLQDLGFLIRGKDGVFHTDPTTTVGNQVPSEAIRQYQTQILRKAAAALEFQGMDKRLVTSAVVALPKDDVQKILTDLKSLPYQIIDPYVVAAAKTPARKKDSLYCLSVQFFDLLENKGKKS